jgi:AraC-like DNA-binding protein
MLKSTATSWSQLDGSIGYNWYGLPFYTGDKVSVSLGELKKSFWWEHTSQNIRIIATSSRGFCEIEATVDGFPRIFQAFLLENQICVIPRGLETTLYWHGKADFLMLEVPPFIFPRTEAGASEIFVMNLDDLGFSDPQIPFQRDVFLKFIHGRRMPDPLQVLEAGEDLACRILKQLAPPMEIDFWLPTEVTIPRPCGPPPGCMERIDFYINKNEGCPIKVKELARFVGLSGDHLTRCLKATKTMGLSDYIRSKKMEKAAERLRAWDANVSEIGLSVGYHDVSHFSLSFKKLFGVSPSAYRRRFRKPDLS